MRTRHDIQSAAFGDLAGDSQQLFQYLDHAWKDFDINAPIYMTCTQEQEIDLRCDTKAYVQKILELRRLNAPKKELQTELDRLSKHKKRLEELAILARRKTYFTQKMIQSQLGPQPFGSEHSEEEVTWRRCHAHWDLDRLMRAWAPGTNFDTDAEERAISADAWLRHYLAATDSAIRLASDATSAQIARTTSATNTATAEGIQGVQKSIGDSEGYESPVITLTMPAGKASKCIICHKLFMRRSELTRHFAATHKAALQQHFQCPVCRRITISPSEFSNHVERVHGKQYAPHFPTEKATISAAIKGSTIPQVFCAICNSNVQARADTFLFKHFNSQHSMETDLLGRRLDCPDCPECMDAYGVNVDGWVAHLVARHNIPQAERCPFCNRFFQSQGIAPHIQRSHFNAASNSLSCPICVQLDGSVVPLYNYPSWRVHALVAGHVADSTPRTAKESDGSTKRKRPEEGPMESLARPATAHKRLRRDSKAASPPPSCALSPLIISDCLYAKDDAARTAYGNPIDVSPPALAKSPLWNLDSSVDQSSGSLSPQSPGSSILTDVDLIDPTLWREWAATSCAPPSSSTANQFALQLTDSAGHHPSLSSTESTVCASPDITPGLLAINSGLPQAIAYDQEGEFFEVESIRNAKMVRGKEQFLIRWKGYTEKDDSWIARHDLSLEVDDLIEEYYRKYGRPSKGPSKQRRKLRIANARSVKAVDGLVREDTEGYRRSKRLAR